jgi:sigma-B regulation protein RsbU (phosphoserine phosphatase)
MFYVKYDTVSQWLTFANAGHNLPLLYRNSEKSCQYLDTEGIILGITETVEFEEKSILLDPGDILVLYTDGVTETAREDGELFGTERLESLLSSLHEEPLQIIIDTIYREVINFSADSLISDDISIVLMRVEQSQSEQQD